MLKCYLEQKIKMPKVLNFEMDIYVYIYIALGCFIKWAYIHLL